MMPLRIALLDPKSIRRIFNKFNNLISAFWLSSLVLGITSIGGILLTSLSHLLESQISNETQKTLGGDFEIVGRVEITDETWAKLKPLLPSGTIFTHVREFTSMVRTGDIHELVEVRAFEPEPAFYESVNFSFRSNIEHPIALSESFNNQENRKKLNIHDSLYLGEAKFEVAAFAIEPTQNFSQTFSLGPKIWIRLKDLKRTKLDQRGSRIRYRYLFKLPVELVSNSLNTGTQEDTFIKSISKTIHPLGFRVTSHLQGQPALRELIGRLNLFLTYCQIFLWLLAGSALGFSLFGYLQKRQNTFAILKSLGFRQRDLIFHQLTQITLLCIVVYAFAVGITAAIAFYFKFPISPFSKNLLNTFVPLISLVWITAALSLSPLKEAQPVDILKQSNSNQDDSNFRKLSPTLMRSIFFLWAWVSIQVGLQTGMKTILKASAMLAALTLGISFFYLLLNFLLKRISRIQFKSLLIRYSLRPISRRSQMYATSLLLFSLGLGFSFFLETLTQSIRREISPSTAENNGFLPNLFIIDLLPHEIPNLKNELNSLGMTHFTLSPWYRGRLTKINGKPFAEETDEFVRTEVNFSERDILYPTERLLQGSHWKTPYVQSTTNLENSKLGVSVSSTYAERLKLRIGDEMEFELSGVPFSAEVKSIRQVRWSDFRPNFFLIFQTGYLTNAPATWIASIHWELNEWRSFFKKHFPSATVFDLKLSTERMNQLIEKVLVFLRAISGLVMATAIILMLLVQAESARTRTEEFSLLYTLGLTRSDIQKSLQIERILLMLVSATIGLFLMILLSYWLIQSQLAIPIVVPGFTLAFILLGVYVFQVVLGVFLKNSLKVRP